MKRILTILIFVSAILSLGFLTQPVKAQFGKLKDKVKEKVEKKISDSGDKKQPADTVSSSQTGEDTTTGTTVKDSTPAASFALYTKYDFVPGDKVIFYDDFSQDEPGEFPSRWNLDQGVFEVGKQNDDAVVVCTDNGSITPKLKGIVLPEKYTVELDLYGNSSGEWNQWYSLAWVDSAGENIAELKLNLFGGTEMYAHADQVSSKTLPSGSMGPGLHTLRFMITKTTIRGYLDHERIVNIPKMDDFLPVGFRVSLFVFDEQYPGIISGFRLAEGGKTLKEQLDETGKIITHGILFESGSYDIKPESYKTLADIGLLLTENPALRLSVEGHTDSDGSDEANMTLSQNRAKAVCEYLVANCKIDGNRLESKGWGETKPIDANTTQEGKANNRRVELVKI